MQSRKLKRRYGVICFFVFVLMIIAIWRLFVLQVIEGDKYRDISDSRLSRNIPVKAPRGEILDRYGRALVTNRVGYSVSVSKTNDSEVINNAVLNLISLFGEREIDTKYKDTLPVTTEKPYRFTFEDDEEKTAADKEKQFKTEMHIEETADAESVIEKYRKKYNFSGEYTDEQVRTLAGVRYEMEKRNFSSNNPFLFAEDVDIETISQIKERFDDFSCVTVYTQPIREYTSGSLAAHILGRTGIINAEEYETLKNKGYGLNDYLGKQGVEKAFEGYLKGTDGINSIERHVKDDKNEIVFSKEPIAGDTVILTIDKDLQRVAEESLEANIKNIAATSKPGSGNDASGGAAVVIDVESGEILAVASYPTYDPGRFNEDYDNLLADEFKPMVNRALTGTYEPGSTYKVATAIGALESGVTDVNEKITTLGVYKYYDHEFMCSIYRASRQTHGTINISQAIQVSCNYYFFELGRRMGIETIDKYSRLLGLGEYTGIELKDEEAKGQIAGPELRAERGEQWYPGDVLQAAIGQSDNLFTPLQIANYIATVANGGTNYEAHLLKYVKSNSTEEIVVEKKPAVRNKIDIKKENLRAVLDGMQLVTSEGTASGAFADFPIKTGGKTGSAQVSKGSSNGIYVGFAPFDNPQIAVAVVVEHGGSGSNVSYIARDIFEQYFFGNKEVTAPYTIKNTLLP